MKLNNIDILTLTKTNINAIKDDYIWDYLSNTGSEMDSTFDDISTSSDRAASTASSIASSSIVSLDKDQLHAAKK
ncbi:hypothetical protein RclHR1_03890023 [Rhizophagus clarus]|uniref:Uncharacterized protein n=1 Tax=Rhizophagus clarus TaxID=94130 RepID=A0A2Z6RDB1_9GLOM|nr:hypothetical protein RclHR1_03890023 [Rhizophagus clarus]